MADPVTLEIRLSKRQGTEYLAEFRTSTETSESRAEGQILINFERLHGEIPDSDRYGQALTGMVFGDERLRMTFAQAQALADSRRRIFRMLLSISGQAPELHSIHWETLRDPSTGYSLFTRKQNWFARIIPSSSLIGGLQPLEGLPRILVVVINPADLSDYKVSTFDTRAEVERITAAIGPGMSVDTLVSSQNTPITFDRLSQAIQDKDILYLLSPIETPKTRDHTGILLQGEDGSAEITQDIEFVELFEKLSPYSRPRLVILPGDENAEGSSKISLASQLVSAGIPAVVTMQQSMLLESNARFMPRLFESLLQHGQIDRAVSEARSAISDYSDWWIPALFSSVMTGQLFTLRKTVNKQAPKTSPTPATRVHPAEETASKVEDVPAEVMGKYRFTSIAQKAIERARSLATGRTRRKVISTSRLLYALIDVGKIEPGILQTLYEYTAVRKSDLYQKVRETYFSESTGVSAKREPGQKEVLPTHISQNAANLLKAAEGLATKLGSSEISAEHILASLMQNQAVSYGAMRRLAEMEIDPTALREAFIGWLGAISDLPMWKEFLYSAVPTPLASSTSELPLTLTFSGFAADSGTVGEDMLDISQDVRAFAALIASTSLTPPLSIGLFGEWGSGKTFFMKKLQEAVQKISRAMIATGRRQQSLPFYKNIVQIEFNAWHYMEGNIWASLGEHILRSLAYQENQRSANQAMIQMLVDNLGLKQKARQLAEQDLAVAQANVQRSDAELQSAKTALEQKKLEIESKLHSAEALDFALTGLQPQLEDFRKQFLLNGPTENAAEIERTLTDTRAALSGARKWLSPVIRARKGWLQILWLFGVLTLTGLIGWGLHLWIATIQEEAVARLWASVVAILTFLGSGLPWVRRQIAWLNQQNAALQKLQERFSAERQKAIVTKEKEVTRLKGEIPGLEKQKNDAERRYKAAVVEEEEARKQLEQATPAKLLESFLQDRAGSTDYSKYLGVLAMIRRDLETLSNLVEQINWQLAPVEPDDVDLMEKRHWINLYKFSEEQERIEQSKQINRIVLYIDDLDRCPPSKVVEVLQAVHLLLAFPLFVVVVGVDARWIKQSLKARYRHILHAEGGIDEEPSGESLFGKATPDDYLEKIFQIPFWLKAMSENSRRQMIKGLLREPSATPVMPDPAVVSPEDDEVLGAPELNSHETLATKSMPAQGSDTFPTLVTEVQPAVIVGSHAHHTLWQRFTRWLLPVADVTKEPLGNLNTEPAIVIPIEPQLPTKLETSSTEAVQENVGQPVREPASETTSRLEERARQLAISPMEKEYMEVLSPLLGRSPRALKRFVNVYRVIKAGLSLADQETFVPNQDSPGPRPYQVVLFLLAADTGLPELARDLLTALKNPALAKLCVEDRQAGHRTLDTELGWLYHKLKFNSTEEAGEAVIAQRELLHTWLDQHGPLVDGGLLHDAANLDPLVQWASLVERFSFQVYPVERESEMEGKSATEHHNDETSLEFNI